MSKIKVRKITPLRAIRLKCLDCNCGSKFEVRLCTASDCPLFSYRFGKNPARRGIGRKRPGMITNHLLSKENKTNKAF